MALYEDLMRNAKPDAEALQSLNKGAIMQGLINYSMYGPENKFNYTFTDEQLQAVTAKELVPL